MTGFISSLSTIARLAIPYFRSEDRWPGRILLASVITCQLSLVGIAVLLNAWYNKFCNALQERNWDAFMDQPCICPQGRRWFSRPISSI